MTQSAGSATGKNETALATVASKQERLAER